jgi:polysaccharide biosynthesis protein PslH
MAEYPFPPQVGSSIVAYNTIKQLSKDCIVDLICLKPNQIDIKKAEFIENQVLVPQKKFARFTRNLFLIANLFSFNPFWSNHMRKKVGEIIDSGNYSIILLFEINALQYCPPSCYEKLVINIEDPLSIKFERMQALSVWSVCQKLKLRLLSKLAESYEKNFLPQLAKVFLLSLSDVNDMRENIIHKNIYHMPYGVNFEGSKPILNFEERERVIICSGNMYHPPNVDGLLYFLNEVFPLILSSCPSAMLWVVGSNPDNRIYESATRFGENVLITGKVKNITEYIERATVSICPIKLKIGVQTKILEAISLGTPVVTTSAGNSGIGGISGTHLWVEDEPHQFAKRVLELLNGIGWDILSREGLKLARDCFSWENSTSQLKKHIKSIPNIV